MESANVGAGHFAKSLMAELGENDGNVMRECKMKAFLAFV